MKKRPMSRENLHEKAQQTYSQHIKILKKDRSKEDKTDLTPKTASGKRGNHKNKKMKELLGAGTPRSDPDKAPPAEIEGIPDPHKLTRRETLKNRLHVSTEEGNSMAIHKSDHRCKKSLLR